MIDADRRDDRDLAVGDVRGVPRSAHADLDDGGIDGCIGERRERHRGHHLEVRQRVLRRLVDDLRVCRHVGEGVDEQAFGQRLAVEADAFGHRLQVWTGEPAGAQIECPQQGVDHPARRRLAVGAGQVDHRVGVLRVAEQPAERSDAVEGRFEASLGPPAEQSALDLGVRGRSCPSIAGPQGRLRGDTDGASVGAFRHDVTTPSSRLRHERSYPGDVMNRQIAGWVTHHWAKWVVLVLSLVVIRGVASFSAASSPASRTTTSAPGCPVTPSRRRSSTPRRQFTNPDAVPAVVLYIERAGRSPRPTWPKPGRRRRDRQGQEGRQQGRRTHPVQGRPGRRSSSPTVNIGTDGWDALPDIVDDIKNDRQEGRRHPRRPASPARQRWAPTRPRRSAASTACCCSPP